MCKNRSENENQPLMMVRMYPVWLELLLALNLRKRRKKLKEKKI